jgi:hypothetical protein
MASFQGNQLIQWVLAINTKWAIMSAMPSRVTLFKMRWRCLSCTRTHFRNRSPLVVLDESDIPLALRTGHTWVAHLMSMLHSSVCECRWNTSYLTLDISQLINILIFSIYQFWFRTRKHLAVTLMYKSPVDICRSCLGEVLFETCVCHECNWNTIHVTFYFGSDFTHYMYWVLHKIFSFYYFRQCIFLKYEK